MSYVALGNVNTRGGVFGQPGRGGGVFNAEQGGFGDSEGSSTFGKLLVLGLIGGGIWWYLKGGGKEALAGSAPAPKARASMFGDGTMKDFRAYARKSYPDYTEKKIESAARNFCLGYHGQGKKARALCR